MATVRTVKKWLLGREIAHMISSAGKTQAEAAQMIETVQSRIAGLVNGMGNITVGDLERLANMLGFTDSGYQAALSELRRDSHQRGRWSSGYHRAYREDLRLLIDAETQAEAVRSAECEVMPGLLQCPAYVRALYADAPDHDGLTLDDRVEARMARQQLYRRDNPPAVHFVLSESCLRRVFGDAAVMREQLAHVIKLTDRSNVMVQVLPFDTPPGRRSPIGNRFTILRVASPGVAGPLELVYTEGEGDIRYLDDKDALTAHELAWTRLSTAALSFADSRRFMNKVAREFK